MKRKQYGIEFDPARWSLGDELEEVARNQTLAQESAIPPDGVMPAQAAGFLNETAFLSTPLSEPVPVSAPEAARGYSHEETIERIVERKISELRVYVLESDISEAQKAVRRVVELSKY